MSSGKRKKAPKHAKFAAARSTIGMTKLRRWKYAAGINGRSAVRLRCTKAIVIITESTKAPRHHTLVHPTLGPIERLGRTVVTDLESDQLPSQSISLNSRRAR